MLEQIKKLREASGAGVVDVKKALEEAQGDQEKAMELLRKRGQDKALKKADRETVEGIISHYIHANNKIGVLVKVLCETDFVARNDEFQELGKDIAMHIAAANPSVITPQEVPEEEIAKEREIWGEQLKNEGKPADIVKNILIGKEKKFRDEHALLTQQFVKDPSLTINDLITQKIGSIGEKIEVREFVRFEL